MSGSTLQKKVIEFLKKKESNKVKTKDIQEEKIVKEINEYDEVKENISTDIRNSITEYQKLLDFIPEANIYKIFKKFDFNKTVMDSHVEVVLQRSRNIDTTDWINVAKKPKKYLKPNKEKKEIVKKFEYENYEGDNEENYQPKKYNEDKYNRYNCPRNYRKRSFNNEFKEDYYYSTRIDYNQRRDYEEDKNKNQNYESDYPKKRPNYESDYPKKRLNYSNYEVEYVPKEEKDSDHNKIEKPAEKNKEHHSDKKITDVPFHPKKPHHYEHYENKEHQNPKVSDKNKRYIKKKKFITEITYVPKEEQTNPVVAQTIEKQETVPEVKRKEVDEPKVKEEPLLILTPDPNSDNSTLMQKDKEVFYADEKPKKENHRSCPSPQPDVSKKLETTSPAKVDEDVKSVPVTNQASSYLNDSYQTNSQTSFDATTQQNYLQQAPTNYNFQQSPHYFQQPMVNNFNNNPVQNNAPNCPMLCLMMPNGVQIPFPIMMPNQNSNPGQTTNPNDYYFQFLNQIGTMMSGMNGNYNMFGNFQNPQPTQPQPQPQAFIQKTEPEKNFSINPNPQTPNIFNQRDYYLYNPSNFDAYFHNN